MMRLRRQADRVIPTRRVSEGPPEAEFQWFPCSRVGLQMVDFHLPLALGFYLDEHR
jgi:hypothetical protein